MHYDEPQPCKHEAFTQCYFNVGPESKTMGQHWNSTGWMSRACWKVKIKKRNLSFYPTNETEAQAQVDIWGGRAAAVISKT